ncbi:MAG: DUF2203 family protein [Pseudobdellovibrio sp.]
MVEIFNIQKPRVFTYSDAKNILPLIYRITEESSKQVKYFMGCLEALPDKESATSLDLQNRINEHIERWQNKLERLGVKPKGLWLADFDNGEGYYCWKYPETQIMYRHGYQDGFTGRILIEQNTGELSKEVFHENSISPN